MTFPAAPALKANRYIRQMDGLLYVNVRNPGEWHEIREFVQPNDPEVVRVSLNCAHDDFSNLDWVCRNIQYRRDVGEMWQFPRETILRGMGDCDDSAILLCSMLRTFENAWVVLGTYQGFGHAWVTTDTNEVLEPTFIYARPVDDPRNYKGYLRFNDQEYAEMRLGGIFGLYGRRINDCAKLRRMAGVPCTGRCERCVVQA